MQKPRNIQLTPMAREIRAKIEADAAEIAWMRRASRYTGRALRDWYTKASRTLF